MNKTVNINIAGFAFIVEETAYLKLSNYLDKLGNNIFDKAEKKEVLDDIESRIAELFQEFKAKEHREVILLKDVDKVIEIMGEPDEIYEKPEGAASFDAHEEHKEPKPKRLYRDVDNGMLGGVCSGLAAYFNTDVIWPRIVFLFLFFTFGSGFLLYIVLWIIVPAATTTAQKLEMQGEAVNFESIKKSFHQTKEQIEKEIEIQKRRYGKKKVKNKTKTAAEEVISSGSLVFAKVFRAFGIAIGAVLWVVAFSMLMATFAAFIGKPIVHYSIGSEFIQHYNLEDLRRIFFGSKFFDWGISAILFSVTMAFFLAGFHLIFGANRKSMVSWTIPSFFFTGLVLIGIGFLQQTKEYQEEAVKETRVELSTISDTLYVKSYPLSENFNFPSAKWTVSNAVFSMKERFAIVDDLLYFSNCKLQFRPSLDESFHLVIFSEAAGKSQEEAMERAAGIQFYFQTEGDTITLQQYFTSPIKNGVRNQKLKYILEVPDEKHIFLDTTITDITSPIYNKQNMTNAQLFGSVRQFKKGILN